jgi:GNAT superfamily N-acetyltransferase
MKLFYRKLTTEDIPAIKDISKDIWEGEDYVPQVIEDMVGFGRVKLFTKDIAWLEGGRVKTEYQKQGIGREMIKYALNYASQVNAKVAQYDTSSKNLGSVALAKYFGFKSKKSMNILGAERLQVKPFKSRHLEVKKVSVDEAKELYKNLDIGPGDEVCIGWSYKPIEAISEEDGEWYIVNSKAILQMIKFDGGGGPEDKFVWMIIYGKPEIAIELIKSNLQRELRYKENKTYDIFCSSEIAGLVENLGFSYDEGEPRAVVLYEKTLN